MGSLGSALDGDEVLRLGDEMGCVMEKVVGEDEEEMMMGCCVREMELWKEMERWVCARSGRGSAYEEDRLRLRER
ncbi:hypothetical protein AAC387_Pa07g2073 [Persea americana]